MEGLAVEVLLVCCVRLCLLAVGGGHGAVAILAVCVGLLIVSTAAAGFRPIGAFHLLPP